MADIIKVDINSFENEIFQHEGVVLVDFWAEWCGPCKMQLPILEKILKEIPSVKVCKINVDENSDLAMKFGITSIPTMMIFKNGVKVEQFIGLKSKTELFEKLKAL